MRLPAGLRELQFALERSIQPAAARSRTAARAAHAPLGSSFNQPLEGVKLPASLTQLELGDCYSQPLGAWAAPPLLEEFKLGCGWQGGPLLLPAGLRRFTFYGVCDASLQSGSQWAHCPQLHTLDLHRALAGARPAGLAGVAAAAAHAAAAAPLRRVAGRRGLAAPR